MQKLLKINRYLFLAIMLGACHKDNPQVIVAKPQNTSSSSECHEYVYTGLFGSGAFVTTGDQYAYPCFNPNNSDELLYVKKKLDSPPAIIQLIKRTISTGQEQILCEGMYISGQPEWGKQGWILFSVGTAPPQIIWKIYEDGTGLAQVTSNGMNCFQPTFNNVGDQFIIMGEGVSGYYRPLFDLNGTIVDSIRYEFTNVFIGAPYCLNGEGKNGFYCYSDHNTNPLGMGFCQLINNSSIERLNTINLTPNGGGLVYSMCQNTQSIFYTQYQLGLYRLDKTSHQTSLVMENCQSNYINSLSMSPDGQNILYERINGHQTSPGSWDIDLQSEIFLYNIATGQQTKLLGEE